MNWLGGGKRHLFKSKKKQEEDYQMEYFVKKAQERKHMEELGFPFFKANDISSLQESQDMIRMRTIEKLFGSKGVKIKSKPKVYLRSLHNKLKFFKSKSGNSIKNCNDLFDLIEMRKKRRAEAFNKDEISCPLNYFTSKQVNEEEKKASIQSFFNTTDLDNEGVDCFSATNSRDSYLFRFKIQKTKIYSQRNGSLHDDNFNFFSEFEENEDNESPFSSFEMNHNEVDKTFSSIYFSFE